MKNINEGYREVNELVKLADLIIKKIAELNINIVKYYLNRNKNFERFYLMDLSYDLFMDNKELVDQFNIIKPFIERILNKPEYDITINFVLTENLTAKGSYSKNRENPYINLYHDDKSFKYFLKIVNNTGEFTVDKLVKVLNQTTKTTLVHELQHAFDDFKSKAKFDTDKKSIEYYKNKANKTNIDNELLSQYLNLPHEYWARFSEYISSKNDNYLKNIGIHKFFDDFKSSEIIELNKIDDIKDRKKLLKALYKYWYLKYEKVIDN